MTHSIFSALLSVGLSIATLATMLPDRADAQAQLRFIGDTRRADFTGPAQSSSQTSIVRIMPSGGLVGGAPAGLTRIRITERGDEPCALRATFTQLAQPPIVDSPTNRRLVRIDLQNSGSRCSANRTRGRIELRAAGPEAVGVFIRSVGTCTNNRSGDRGLLVKGLTGTSFMIDDDTGEPGQTSAISPDEQPNCDEETYTYSRCRAREVAIGLDVKLKVIGGKQSITGLRLRCKRFGTVPTGTFGAVRSN